MMDWRRSRILPFAVAVIAIRPNADSTYLCASNSATTWAAD